METPLFKEWTLLQIEGEDPQPVVEQAAAPEKASPPKKGSAAAKPKVVEEVIDNRPRTIQFKRDFAEEQQGQGMKITEPFATKLATQFMCVQVVENDKVLEKIQINLSELLWPENEQIVST